MISIISVIDEKIIPATNYSFSVEEVQDFLEDLFRLEDDKKQYSTTNRWSILFSKQWIENVPELMLASKPNIFSVASWCFRRKSFDDDITSEKIVGEFLDLLHLSKEEAQKWFVFNPVSYTFNSSLYKEKDLIDLISQKLGIPETNKTLSFEGQTFIKSNPGSLGQAPFIQTLYANQSIQKCLILTQFDFQELYPMSNNNRNETGYKNSILQQIFYGAPGTGKSHKVNETTEQQPKENVFRTTFHPDSDYSTFVGCYKPTMKPTGVILASKENEEVITYKFVAQTFTKAYIRAWQTNENVFLVIEEINRGNCAQIFGDLFQLLDRENGFSEYPVDADTDLADFIRTELANSDRTDIPAEVKNGQKLMLPSNLYIWATMNTSDQSLFPIDSAFKRRWEWKYLPINNHEDKNYKIEIGSTKYDWWGFLSKINEVIGNTTSSEDKKLGYFFAKANAKGIVTAEQFVGKVLFYLWNDVFKNYGFDNQIFDKGDNKKFDFSEFFKQDGSPNVDMVNKFLGKLDETIDKENSFVEKAKDENGQGE